MTEFELGWLVGFFEGEGNFAFTSADRSALTARGTIRLCVVQSDLPLLERVQALTGMGNIISVRRYQPHHKPHWRWEIFGNNACRLASALLPHLSPRRQGQWEEAFESWAFVRDLGADRRAIRGLACINGHPWTEETTYRAPNGPDRKHCRICREAAGRRSKAKVA